MSETSTKQTNKKNASILNVEILPPLYGITALNKKTIAVERIKDKTIGLTPKSAPLTNLFAKNLFKIIATIMMIIIEGRITPMVAQIAPKTPPV